MKQKAEQNNAPARMDFDQSAEENRVAFVARLVSGGWSRREAEAEWERLQTEED